MPAGGLGQSPRGSTPEDPCDPLPHVVTMPVFRGCQVTFRWVVLSIVRIASKRYSLSSAAAAQTAQPEFEDSASFSTRRPT